MLRRKLHSGTFKTKKSRAGLVRVLPLCNLRPSIIYSVPSDRVYRVKDPLLTFSTHTSRARYRDRPDRAKNQSYCTTRYRVFGKKTGTSCFDLEVPLCKLRPSVCDFVPCDRIMQRTYYWHFSLIEAFFRV